MATTIYPWLNIIAAFSERDQVIGYGGDLPWPRLSKDMKRFKSLTKNQIVIMGHNTFKSLNCKPLPARRNIVLSTSPLDPRIKLTAPTSKEETILASIETVKKLLLSRSILSDKDPNGQAWIIGGQSIYEQFLPYANKVYITVVHKKFYGDRHFPTIDQSIWELESSESIDEIIPLTFQVWKRKEQC